MALKLLASLLSLAFALLAAEGALRLLGIEPERHAPPQWLALHEGVFKNLGIWGQGLIKRPSRFKEAGVTMGEYVPGAAFKVQYDSNPRGYFDSDNGVLMTVNSLGMRDRAQQVSVEKPAGSYRILGLGDSFTFGVGVRDEDTFLRGLEGRLNGGGARRFEVLNAGVQGYNTRDEVLYLENQWLKMGLDPDLVLIVFYLNDAYSDSAILNMGQTMGTDLKQPEGMARYSRLWDMAQHEVRVRKVSAATKAYYNKQFFSEAGSFLDKLGKNQVDWTVSREALGRVAALARDGGFKAGVVIFPELHNLRGGYPFEQIHELVRSSCEGFGLPVLDLFEVYSGNDASVLWVHPSDHHPNEGAHALAAGAIEEFVRAEFLGSADKLAE